ncbi:replication protein RepA [Tautonia rosea]|uniref:replication protein RepA n=1 Tax=Tautonia rosea TaxID=2728037 RepID=UPI001474C5A5|nr:replication protein RepA [Tautonia rosea]
MTKPATRKKSPAEQLLFSRTAERLLEASASIRSEPPDRIDFLHTVQCQCGIPYRNPGDAIREWDRKQGGAALRIEAGSAIDPQTGEFVKLGLPFGEKPRLVLIHLASEAVRTGSPVVDVEDSMTAFARSLGVETNGQQLRSLKDQLARLSASTVRMGMVEEGRAVQVNTQIVTAFDLWFPKQPDQRVLWPSTVRLGHEFFQSLGRHAVPLDHRAVAALSSSSMALDIYVWLAQRLHRVPVARPQFIPWTAVYEQFGQGYKRLRDFRRNFIQTLKHVQATYPDARMDLNEEGLTLEHSPPPVAPKTVSMPGFGKGSHGKLVAPPSRKTENEPAA